MKYRLFIPVLIAVFAIPMGLLMIPAMTVVPPPVALLAQRHQVVCPNWLSAVKMFAASDAPITVKQLAKTSALKEPRVVLDAQSAPIVLSSTKLFSAGVMASGNDIAVWGRCPSSKTQGIVQFVHPKIADIVLVNSDDVEAVLTYELMGEQEEHTKVSADISVAPHTSQVLPIGAHATGQTPIGVLLKVNRGRLSAIGRAQSTSAGNFSEVTKAATSQIIPGISDMATATKITLTNPSTKRASVNVSALVSQEIPLAGAQKIVVESRRSRTIDLSKALSGDAVGLKVVADEAVAASITSYRGKDFATSVGTEPMLVGRLLGPGGGQLLISNPNEGPVRVSVTMRSAQSLVSQTNDIEIAPGATWRGDALAGSEVQYDLLATAPVAAAVSRYWVTGVMIMPFSPLATPKAQDVTIIYDPRLS